MPGTVVAKTDGMDGQREVREQNKKREGKRREGCDTGSLTVRNTTQGLKEVAQWVREIAVKPEGLSSIHRIHMVGRERHLLQVVP